MSRAILSVLLQIGFALPLLGQPYWLAASGDIFRCNIVWREYQPAIMPALPWAQELDYNLMHREGFTNDPASRLQKQSGSDEHSIVADAQFVDPAQGDYRVKDGSPALSLAILFLDACLAARLPDKGGEDQTLKPMDKNKAWLAPLFGEEAVPTSEFKGNPDDAVWLPNESVAKAWMEYVKTGATSDTTPPPVPFNVKSISKTDQGTEITWSAEADFESGIQQFIVLRDGQELARVPEKPIGKFGRPLFQSMTYHDTPAQPMPEMRCLDASAKSGEKHSYVVVTVNSGGLKSEPSLPSP